MIQCNPQKAEAFITLKEAAQMLCLPYFKIQRAAKAGAFPTYQLANSRKLVLLSEVIATINASKVGGAS